MSTQPPNEPGWQGQPPNTNVQPWQPQDYSQPTQQHPNYLPQQPFSQPQQNQQQPQGPQQPGQFQPVPLQPRQKRSRRRLWLILAIIGGVLAFSCAICGVAGAFAPPTQHAAQPTPTAIATDTPTSAPVLIATDTPTDTPVPTSQPTAKPTAATGNLTATYGTPRLGGPISDFIGKYGKPNDHTDTNSFHWFRDSSSNADGLIVWELTHPNQVDSIDVQSVNGDMPNMSAAVALCTVYNPSDAHQLKRIPLVSASGQASGVDVVYLSASLAHVFTPDDFTDSQQNNVQPGTFDIQYLYKGDGTQNMDSCSILPGEQQTQG